MSKKSTNGNLAQGGLGLATGEQVYVGCDVHADKYQVALWSPQRQGWAGEWVQPADDAALLRRLGQFRPHIVKVVYEAGPTGFGLARALRAAGFKAEVIAPNLTPRAPTEPDKCDKLDARKLSCQAAQDKVLHPVYIPTVREEQDRQVFRVREQQKKRLAQLKQRIKALLLYHGLRSPAGLKSWSLAGIAELRAMVLPEMLRWSLDELLSELETARQAMMRCNRQLQKMARSERYKTLVDRLRTVPGVGLIVALGFILELLDPARFPSGRHLAKLLALCPRVESSGSQSRACGRAPGGHDALRALLIEAAWRWVRGDAYARMMFNKYQAGTASRLKAIVAVARKLALILWNLLRGELPYVPGLVRVPPAAVGLKPKARKPKREERKPKREERQQPDRAGGHLGTAC